MRWPREFGGGGVHRGEIVGMKKFRDGGAGERGGGAAEFAGEREVHREEAALGVVAVGRVGAGFPGPEPIFSRRNGDARSGIAWHG